MIPEGEDTGESCSLPWVCVTSQSNSTPVRSVLDPSRPLQSLDPPEKSGGDSVSTKTQKLTLNHLLPTGTARLPQIRYLHLVQDLTLVAVTDIEDAYMRVYLEDEGARKITFFAYKTKAVVKAPIKNCTNSRIIPVVTGYWIPLSPIRSALRNQALIMRQITL